MSIANNIMLLNMYAKDQVLCQGLNYDQDIMQKVCASIQLQCYEMEGPCYPVNGNNFILTTFQWMGGL
jgi:hypothetical protein